jgi:6-pyruvoyltetrahydropterin/6-carboxytetrahydropterin synthase
MTFLSRRIGFSAAHRYFQKEFSEEKNKEIFGRCYTPHGHGHNYVLEITLSGKIHPQTGMVINLAEVDRILKEVIDPLDHHHLNFDVPAFKDIVPTTENLARYCFEEVLKRLPSPTKLERARIYECDTLWADYHG